MAELLVLNYEHLVSPALQIPKDTIMIKWT